MARGDFNPFNQFFIELGKGNFDFSTLTIVTERIRKGSVMARTPSYLGIVLGEDLPFGFEGSATIKKEKMYFFSGERSNPGARAKPVDT